MWTTQFRLNVMANVYIYMDFDENAVLAENFTDTLSC